MHVLYRVKTARTNEPLRYSLRSLAYLGDGHHTVHMVGRGIPTWVVGVEALRPVGEGHRGKWDNLVADLVFACERWGNREFVLMDDDMFVLSPALHVPTQHRGPISARTGTTPSAYLRSLARTRYVLEGMGYDNPLDYELHVPMVMTADGVVEALGPLVHSARPVQARSMYGNVRGVGGHRADDVKVRKHTDELSLPFTSVSPGTWLSHGPTIRSLLPTPSAYEQ